MKLKANMYAPILFGVILLLSGISQTLTELVLKIADHPFLAATIIQFLVYLLPLAFYCRMRGLNMVSQIKLRSVPAKKIPFLAIVTTILFTSIVLLRYVGLFFLNSAFVDTPGALYIPMEGSSTFLVLLCNVILPALFEESIFRGLFLEEYRSFGPVWAISISSLMYAMVHLSWENFVYYLVIGVFLSLITVISDSIVPALVLHVVMNLSYLYVTPSVVEYLRQAGKSPLLPYLLVAFFILLFVFLFSRLENIYQDRVYEEMLQSRKEMLKKEIERSRDQNEEPKDKKDLRWITFKEIFLSPIFLVTVAVFIMLASGILF